MLKDKTGAQFKVNFQCKNFPRRKNIKRRPMAKAESQEKRKYLARKRS